MTRKYREWTDEQLIEAVRTSESVADVLRKINLRTVGGNYLNIMRNINRLNLDISHFKGQGWSKLKQLKEFKDYGHAKNCKKHLILSRGHTCERCKQSVWENLPIPLEIHHIDGIRLNNHESNLQLLCPNCHALTDNYRNKRRNN